MIAEGIVPAKAVAGPVNIVHAPAMTAGMVRAVRLLARVSSPKKPGSRGWRWSLRAVSAMPLIRDGCRDDPGSRKD